VLIVDDVPQNISVFNEILKRHYTVAAATSGEKALRIASTDPQPDLILLDIVMPGIDGFDVYRRLQADEHTRHICVVFLTASGGAVDSPRDLDLRDVEFLTKPVSPTQLLDAVARSLRR
jgi:putative two-component system response regulator